MSTSAPTTAPPAHRPALTDQQLGELLPLLQLADSAELKVTIPPEHLRDALAALDLDPLDAQIRQVFFFETPDLRLDRSGVVVRARRVAGRPDDTVVKLRPVDPAKVSSKLRRTEGFGIEVDAMPGGFVCSGSLKAQAAADVRTVVRDAKSPRKLFTKPQRALFERYAPDGVTLDDLKVLGPIFVLKLRSVPRIVERKLVAELWLYPDESRIIELSAKSPPREAFDLAARLRAYLAGRGIDTSGEQATKTRRALELLAG
ncbi:MAG TPA: hypothetical protein VFG42_20390 [Baekduia sp.]|uniref:hypothetical protein n=1 Tax=Baekduia sp. TaxID=2600305 RepID=UPI002D799BB9|nr:hypothetical protein [Baekduia sp.]HET6509166.1 hypothetical protein [Baekduia sp.]